MSCHRQCHLLCFLRRRHNGSGETNWLPVTCNINKPFTITLSSIFIYLYIIYTKHAIANVYPVKRAIRLSICHFKSFHISRLNILNDVHKTEHWIFKCIYGAKRMFIVSWSLMKRFSREQIRTSRIRKCETIIKDVFILKEWSSLSGNR